MGNFDYKSFYNKAGLENGWDFSKLKCTVEGQMWDFYQEVRKKCKKRVQQKQGIDKCHLFVFDNNELGKNFWKNSGWTLREDIDVMSKNC